MTQDDILDKSEQKEIEQLYDVKLLTEKDWKLVFEKVGFKDISVYTKYEYVVNEPSSTKNQPSQTIDPKIFNLLQQHSKLLLKYKEKLGYRIYRCVK